LSLSRRFLGVKSRSCFGGLPVRLIIGGGSRDEQGWGKTGEFAANSLEELVFSQFFSDSSEEIEFESCEDSP